MELNHYNPPSQPKQTACLGKQCKGRVETMPLHIQRVPFYDSDLCLQRKVTALGTRKNRTVDLNDKIAFAIVMLCQWESGRRRQGLSMAEANK